MNKRPTANTLEWLYAELPDLVAAGLIAPEAAEAIRARYGEPQRRSASSVAVIGLSVLGAGFIIGGIILLLASNWEQLGHSLRALISFLPLLSGQALAFFTLARRGESTAWREGSGLFLTGAIGASIAMVGQTYHLPGDMGDYLWGWILLAWPLIYLLNASTVALLAMAGALAWASDASTPWKGMYIWLFLAGLLPHLALACRANPRGLRFQFLSWGFVLYLMAMPFAFKMYYESHAWFSGYTMLFTLMLLFGLTPQGGPWGNAYRLVGGLACLVIAVMLTFPFTWDMLEERDYDGVVVKFHFMLLPFLLWLTIPGCYLVLTGFHAVHRNRLALLWGALPVLVIGGRWLIHYGLSPDLMLVLSYAYVLVLAIASIREGVAQGSVGLTNIGMLMLAAFAAIRFFDLDLPFVVRGVLFIVIGIGFLGGNVYLARRARATRRVVS